MKKFYYILCLLLPVLAFVGCTDESLYDNDDEQITLSYKVTLDDEAKSRAIGDGSNVDQLLVGIFQNGTQLTQQEFTVEDNKANVTLQLLKNQDYQLVFWAQTKGNGVYNTGDLSNITIDYSNFEKKQVEATDLDAFYATRTVSLENPGTPGVTLTRPFTQFGIGVYGNDVEKDKITSAEIKIKGGLYTAFKPLAEGEKAIYGGDDEEYTFMFTELNDKSNSFVISDKNYTLLTTNYFLVPTDVENPKVSGSVSLKDDSGNSVSDFNFTEAPLVLNARVNIGKGLTEVWDGVYVETLPDADNDGIIHIENTQQLAYLIKYGLRGTAESPAKVHLCKDLDMNATAITRDANYAMQYVSFDGGGNTLYRLGTALFGNAKNITVTNLNIESSIIEDTGHVGIVADTLKGNCTLQDIIIKESTAKTTAGAAGGMVGYIVRSSEKDRDETLTVTFSNCDLVGVTANGSLSEGKFVGLLSGYDNGETLAFDADCSAENTSVADYTSPYKKENQSVWITENLTDTYDGWLGTETYRRGVVKFNDVQLVPKWDGTTTVDPIVENNVKLIYSPYDLATLQGAKPASIEFMTSVDMASKTFTPIITLKNLTGNGKTLHNLKVDTMQDESNSYGGAFIRNTGGGTHQDLTIDNADIKVVHDSNGTTGNAYGGILAASVSSTHTMSNITIKNSKLYAVCKMGGLVGRVHGGTFTCTGCTVDNCTLENYNAKDDDVFDISGVMGSITATAYAVFGTAGEAGGLIGFLCTSANITNCSVSQTTINCFGQRDQEIKINATLTGTSTGTHGYYLVAGRHVNEFIGDIRTIYANTNITINGCTLNNNTYGANSTQGDNKGHLPNQHNCHFYSFTRSNTYTKVSSGLISDSNITFVYDVKASTPFVGCIYYVGIDDEILGKTIRYGDVRGKVTIDDLVIDDINEFVGGPLNNIGDNGIERAKWTQVKYPSNAIIINNAD